MDTLKKELIGIVTIFLLFASVMLPSIIYFKYSDVVNPEDSFASASVSLTVVGNETVPEVPGDGSGTGGGSGGGASISPQTHILDFTIKDEYITYLNTHDKIKTIFKGGVEYNFDVSNSINKERLTLKFRKESYVIDFGELAYFDLDSDGTNDMSVYLLEEKGAKFTSLYTPEPGETVPKMSKEKIEYPSSIEIPGIGKLSFIFIFVLLALAILIVFIYNHLRLRRIEKTHKSRVNSIYSNYRKNKKTKEEKEKTRNKLKKQLDLLAKAHNLGYVSKESYSKGKQRIKNMMGKI